jgi:hypothetical protein
VLGVYGAGAFARWLPVNIAYLESNQGAVTAWDSKAWTYCRLTWISGVPRSHFVEVPAFIIWESCVNSNFAFLQLSTSVRALDLMTSIDSLCWFLETEHRKTTSILQRRGNRCAGDERQFDDQTCHCAKLFKAGISCALGPMAKRVESGARQWKATRWTLEW